MTRPLRLLACAAAVALAACGGDGDPGDNSNYNALAAWNNFLAPGAPRSWTATGTSNGKTYELSVGIAPMADAEFPVTGATANRLAITASVREGTTTIGSSVTQLYFDDDLLVLGTRAGPVGSGSTCGAATSASVPPPVAKIANAGPLFTANELDGCTSGAAKTGTTTATWSVELDQRTRLTYFCINSSIADTRGNVQGTENDCVEIDNAGTLGNRARITVTVPGTLAITAYTP
jgi:hypothetical protein